MRSIARCAALLPLFLLVLALPAHADPMDDFSIIGGGATIDFSLPATTTQVCLSCIGGPNDQFIFGPVTGTVNGVSQTIHLNFVVGGGCSSCQTILLNYPSTAWTIFLPTLYQITFSGMYPNQDATLAFVPGDYMTGGYNNSQPGFFLPFEIKVTSAATPEPPTLLLSLGGILAVLLIKRWRPVTAI
jgi:hypothetical protein